MSQVSRMDRSASTVTHTPRTAPAPRTRTTERVLGVQPQLQTGNGCGTTSLAMALAHVLGRRVTQAEIDADIRTMDIFTSASNIRDAARDRGIDGRLVNAMTRRDVTAALDRGRPIVFLSDMTPNDAGDVASMHWRVIDGYRTRNGQLELHVVDPHGTQRWIGWDALQPYWGNIRGIGAQTGYNRFGIVLGANQNDRINQPDRVSGVFATEMLIDGISDVTNDVSAIGRGRVWRVFSFLVNILQALLSLFLLPFQFLFRCRSEEEVTSTTRIVRTERTRLAWYEREDSRSAPRNPAIQPMANVTTGAALRPPDQRVA